MELTTKRSYEIDFGASIPEMNERKNRDDVFIYPEEIIGKTCGECMRCEERTHGKDGYHCMMRKYDIDIQPGDKACVSLNTGSRSRPSRRSRSTRWWRS